MHFSLTYLYGEIDMSRYQFLGKFKVGLKVIQTETFGNEVYVYYPISDSEYYTEKETH